MAKSINTADMKRLIIRIAEEEGVPANVLLAIAEKESGFNPKALGDNGKSYGMFQIYTTAHPDYRGGFDPEQNTRYAARMVKGLMKRYPNDIAKVFERYNGSGQMARSYAADVMQRIYPKYNSVANNANQIPVNINNKTLKGQIAMSEQNSNNNANTASDMIMSNLGSQYYTPTNPILENRDLLTSGGSKQAQLIDIATKGRPDAKAQLQLYLNGLMSFEELNAKYPEMVQTLGLTQETERKSPYSPYTTNMLDNMYKQLMPTDEQIRQAQQNVAQQNKQTIDAYNQQRDALTKVMSDAYNKQVNTIAQNPYGDIPNGVYVDPEQYARATANDNFYDTFYGLQGKVSPVQSRQRLVNQALAARNADLVNRYGVPLEEAKQIAATQYNNQVAAAKQNVEYAKVQYYLGNLSAQQLMKVLQENNNTINNARENATKQYSDFMSKVMPEMIQQDAETTRRVLQNQGAVDTQAMQNAGSIVNNNINANSDRDIARYEGEVSQRGQDINANTQMYNTNVGALTDAAKLQQSQSQFETMAPYKQFGTMAPMGYIPNVDLGGTAQNLGIPVQLRQNFQPDRVGNNSPLQTGFQNAAANFLGRFVPNTNQEDNQ